MDVLDQTLMKLKKMDLTLKIISDGNYATNECKVEFVKWNPETWQKDIQDADFCLLPEKLTGRAVFKSPNKTHQAWALGMPVAKNPEELERFMDGAERQKEADERYQWAKDNCDIKVAAQKMQDVINSIKK